MGAGHQIVDDMLAVVGRGGQHAFGAADVHDADAVLASDVAPLIEFAGWRVFGSPWASGAVTAAQILGILELRGAANGLNRCERPANDTPRADPEGERLNVVRGCAVFVGSPWHGDLKAPCRICADLIRPDRRFGVQFSTWLFSARYVRGETDMAGLPSMLRGVDARAVHALGPVRHVTGVDRCARRLDR
jgi:hypothetical protein